MAAALLLVVLLASRPWSRPVGVVPWLLGGGLAVAATAGLVAAATTLVVQNNLWDRYLLVYLAVTAVAMIGEPRRERTASVDGPVRSTASGPEPARRSATS